MFICMWAGRQECLYACGQEDRHVYMHVGRETGMFIFMWAGRQEDIYFAP